MGNAVVKAFFINSYVIGEWDRMEDVLQLIGEVGLPIGGALAAGFFIFLVMKL